MSRSVLETIVERCLDRLREAKRREPSAALARRADAAEAARPFLVPLRHPERLNVIAEFKPASPSRGPIQPAADVARIARDYEAGGAVAMSVVTEPEFFASGLDRLEAARGACSLPLLRKDFLVDPYQVDEARAAGADAVLLIVSLLEAPALRDLMDSVHGRGMAALVEVRDESEIERALDAGAKLVGINHRDLRDLSVDPGRALRLLPLLPPEITAVAESGLAEKSQLLALKAAGCHAFLIGTHLMSARSPREALERLLR